MDKGIEALREAVRRAPLTKPEGLSPEWQAYFDAVTPLHVAELIAALEQARQYSKKRDEENQDLMLTIGRLRVEREQLESAPNGMMQLSNELAEMKRKCVDVPDGWELAPSRPTQRMLAAGYQAYMKGPHNGRFYRTYQAMLSACGTIEGSE